VGFYFKSNYILSAILKKKNALVRGGGIVFVDPGVVHDLGQCGSFSLIDSEHALDQLFGRVGDID